MKLLLILLSIFVLSNCDRDYSDTPELAQLLGGAASDLYLRAQAVQEFVFPRDHAGHDGYKNEWWYLTGQLTDNSGREFGYQLTFFRIALSPKKSKNPSAWATQYVWMGHAAISDIDEQHHLQEQRLSREANGLAGVDPDPLHVWLEDWHLTASNDNDFPWQISLNADDFSLVLSLLPEKPTVLHGENGLSQKGDQSGNASYYYSITRLKSEGMLTIADIKYKVTGKSWLDREWSTSVLAKDQQGWDWFSLQLADGRDLMFYQIRKKNGDSDLHSAGTLIGKDGSVRAIKRDDISLNINEHWNSPSGAVYPLSWTMQLEGEAHSWRIEAAFKQQEMLTAVNYWEGVVVVNDEKTGESIGKGYLEMTGY